MGTTPHYSRVVRVSEETFTFTSGANEERLRAARRGEARAEAYAEEESCGKEGRKRKGKSQGGSLGMLA